MKVCMLIWSYWPGPEGGSERQCRMVSNELGARGVDCEILTSWPSFFLPRIQTDGSNRIHRFGLLCPIAVLSGRVLKYIERGVRHLRSFSKPEELIKFEQAQRMIEFWLMLPFVWVARLSFLVELAVFFPWRKPSYDVIHLHEPSWLGGVAVWVSRKSGSRVLCQEATSPALPVIGYDVPFRGLWARLRREADYIAMAPYIRDDLKAKGIGDDRIFMLPNGVSLPPTTAECAKQREVVYIGNFSQGAEWKAFDVLIEAWTKVYRREPKGHMTLVGDGDHSVWKELARKSGCLDSLTFAGRTSVPGSFYSRAGVFVLPSRVEGMSNALLEAQSWGLPAVVSDIPGNVALVNHGINGLIVPVGDANALAESVLLLLENPELRVRLGRAAREKIEKEFALEHVTERLISIYSRIIAGNA